MRNATSSEGEYFPSSMAFTVWRVTPMRSASACCVISRCSKRSRRMWLLMGPAPMSGATTVVVELRAVPGQLRHPDGKQYAMREQPGAGADVDRADRQECTDQQHVERGPRRAQLDQPFPLVNWRPRFARRAKGDHSVGDDLQDHDRDDQQHEQLQIVCMRACWIEHVQRHIAEIDRECQQQDKIDPRALFTK